MAAIVVAGMVGAWAIGGRSHVANEYNRRVIEEFRANAGLVGGPYEGAQLLLLTSTGARTGNAHTTPLMYLADAGRYVVFGSKGGAPTNPDWYYNLRANPLATVEVGTETLPVRATVASGGERRRLWDAQSERRPQFADYAARTTREIPVVVLEPV
jgi:deazaflavin-dependent oxidoreductase (nitroreductase family)